MVYEYSTGVRLIEDEASHRPRQFPFEPSVVLHVGLAPRHSGVPAQVMTRRIAGLVYWEEAA